MPNNDAVTLKLMEYGDLSSLLVEYPDYNSLGLTLASLGSFKGTGSWSTET